MPVEETQAFISVEQGRFSVGESVAYRSIAGRLWLEYLGLMDIRFFIINTLCRMDMHDVPFCIGF